MILRGMSGASTGALSGASSGACLGHHRQCPTGRVFQYRVGSGIGKKYRYPSNWNKLGACLSSRFMPSIMKCYFAQDPKYEFAVMANTKGYEREIFPNRRRQIQHNTSTSPYGSSFTPRRFRMRANQKPSEIALH